MRKAISMLLILVLAASLSACAEKGETGVTEEPEAVKDVGIKITYTLRDGTEVGSTEGTNSVKLELSEKFSVSGVIRVELSDDQKYFFFDFDENLEEALIYCPDSVFEYKFDSKTKAYFPPTAAIGNRSQTENPVISVRIPSKDELESERNIALNPYDQTNNQTSYPHASTNSVHADTGEWDARNAIDGFTKSGAHGVYPDQSWGPSYDSNDMYWQVDFGREVSVEGIGIIIRADFDHDAHFTSAVLEFSDGSTQKIDMSKTGEIQKFEINGEKQTSYIKIKDFVKGFEAWTGLMEVEVYGSCGE